MKKNFKSMKLTAHLHEVHGRCGDPKLGEVAVVCPDTLLAEMLRKKGLVQIPKGRTGRSF